MKLIVLLFGFATSLHGAHLPPEIPKCKISDPNIKECLTSSAEKSAVIFAKGNKELVLPSLDPIYLDEFAIDPEPGPFNIYQKYTDIVLQGASVGKFNDLGFNLDSCTMWLNHTIDHLTASADYELRGQILLLPVNAKGHITAGFDNFIFYIKATCEKFKKHGKEYIRVVATELDLIASHVKFNFGVLIDGNPQLDKDIHKVIDDNPLEFYEIMRPSCIKIWNVAVLKIMNTIFTQIPLDELFED